MIWRLIRDGGGTGAWNMAVDEALLLGQSEAGALPTVRFYQWKPHCFSLGRVQRLTPEDIERLEGVDLVRRPTGGRGVWHADEVTYSVTLGLERLPAGSTSVAGSYAWLSRAWVQGLGTLGIVTELAPAGVRAAGFNCFSGSAGSDFLANGKKLVGAAQCRNENAILQHGSLLLRSDVSTWERLTKGTMESATSLQQLGLDESRADVEDALCEGLRLAMNATIVPGELTRKELELAERLQEEKYATSRWTLGQAHGVRRAAIREVD